MGNWIPGVGGLSPGEIGETVGGAIGGSGGSGSTPEDGNNGIVESVLDVPADFANSITGTGENLGWFGVVDRRLDPRSWGEGMPDWADPSEATTGISGFFAGAVGSVGEVVDEASQGAGRSLWRNPKLLALVVLAGLLALAPYADLLAGVAQE